VCSSLHGKVDDTYKANKIVLGRDVALEVYVEGRWLVPQTMQMQVSSVDCTLIGKIWGAGSALLLEVIPDSDPFKPRGCWGEQRGQLCDRVATEIVTNGCADNMSGTSEVPQLADPLCATRKSAEVGHLRTHAPQQITSPLAHRK
jgi:hypothetical protein